MNRIFGMVMAAGLILGNTSVADAQVSVSIGDPYYGTGVQIGRPYGYGYGMGGTGTTYYGSNYVAPGYGLGGTGTTYYGSNYVAPGTTYFSTGTYAPGPYFYRPPVYSLPPPVIVPYRTYGYGYRPYGYRRGFGIPFLGGRRW